VVVKSDEVAQKQAAEAMDTDKPAEDDAEAKSAGEDDGHEGEHGDDMETEGGVEAGNETGGGGGQQGLGNGNPFDPIALDNDSDEEEEEMGEPGPLTHLWVALECRVDKIPSEGCPVPAPGHSLCPDARISHDYYPNSRLNPATTLRFI